MPQKVLLPNLFQHGCFLTNFLANLKILGGDATPPRPPSGISLDGVVDSVPPDKGCEVLDGELTHE